MCHSFLTHSSVDGHLGCFHVLANMNNAAMNIWGTLVSFNSDFLSVYAQQWDCCQPHLLLLLWNDSFNQYFFPCVLRMTLLIYHPGKNQENSHWNYFLCSIVHTRSSSWERLIIDMQTEVSINDLLNLQHMEKLKTGNSCAKQPLMLLYKLIYGNHVKINPLNFFCYLCPHSFNQNLLRSVCKELGIPLCAKQIKLVIS